MHPRVADGAAYTAPVLPLPRLVSLIVVLVLTLAAGGCGGDSSAPPTAATSATVDPAVELLLSTGLDQLETGDQAAAETTFDTVLTLEPDNSYAHYNLGLIAQDRGDLDAARASYERALDTDATFVPALYNLGILTEKEDLQAAVDLYRRAVAADASFAPAHMRLGFALTHLGEDEEAARFLQRGLELDPSMADVEAPSYD